MSTKDFVLAFKKEKSEFKEIYGSVGDYEQFLKWAEVQKLERIHVDLKELVNCFKKG